MGVGGRAFGRARTRLALTGALVALAAAALPSSAGAVASILDNQSALPDIDPSAQPGTPSAAQRSAVKALDAHATWNGFDTPASLINYGGYLGSRPAGDATSAARGWIAAHRTLFKLTAADVSALDVVSDSPLVGTAGHAVIFNQRFGSLDSGQNGMVTVGINGKGVFYVSSSAAGSQAAPAAATLSPVDAWRAAASNAGLAVSSDAISGVRSKGDATTFQVDGLTTPLVPGTKEGLSQSAQLVAFPTPDGVHSAYETTVIDDAAGALAAYKSMVDARTGEVLFRQNAVDQLAAADANDTFSGTTAGAGHCGPRHAIPVDAGIHSIFVIASANNPSDDIVLKLIDPNGTVVASEDTGTSPEAIHYSKPNGGALAVGTWRTQVCQFDKTVPAFPYTGTWSRTPPRSTGRRPIPSGSTSRPTRRSTTRTPTPGSSAAGSPRTGWSRLRPGRGQPRLARAVGRRRRQRLDDHDRSATTPRPPRRGSAR